ncbi:MAG: phenylalanine--tRNA ligase subunit beta [Candidatus Woesearchaeota archaeon]
MPTIKINRKVLESLIGKKLSTEELKDRISMIGTALEDINENEIIVEVFPNRPDMLSEQGFARALSSFLGVKGKTGLKKYKVNKPLKDYKVYVSKENLNVRPYTACAIVKNLKLDDEKIKEIIQIQEKLHITFCRRRKKAAIGIYPLDKIKLPIYFEAKKPNEIKFKPLDTNAEMTALEILEKHDKGKEFKHLVDGLNKYAIFRDSANNILSFTPIINSDYTGKVDESTKEVFIEVSGFDLRTNVYVLNILVCALADMSEDVEIYQMEVIYPTNYKEIKAENFELKKSKNEILLISPKLEPRKLKFDLSFVNKWLGLSLNENEVKKLLEKMGFGYEKITKKGKIEHIALIPAYRADILHQVDLTEDIAIAYGYENFKPEIPKKATTGNEDIFEKFKKKIAYLLIGLGLMETSSYHLTNKEILLKMNLDENDLKDIVEIADSKSAEHNILRKSLLPNLMEILSKNTHNEYPQNIFEIGIVFNQDKNEETGVKEKTNLAVAISDINADYTKIRQILEYLLNSIGFNENNYQIKEAEHKSFIKGRCAKIVLKLNQNEQEIGFLGEIHPSVLEKFGVEMPVSMLEIELGFLFTFIN